MHQYNIPIKLYIRITYARSSTKINNELYYYTYYALCILDFDGRNLRYMMIMKLKFVFVLIKLSTIFSFYTFINGYFSFRLLYFLFYFFHYFSIQN